MKYGSQNQTNIEKFLKLKSMVKEKTLNIEIVSGSMSPYIRKGSVIDVEYKEYEDLTPCDIIVFWRNGILICHILVKTEIDTFITRALDTKILDEPNPRFFYLGVVSNVKFNWFQKFLLKRSFKNSN